MNEADQLLGQSNDHKWLNVDSLCFALLFLLFSARFKPAKWRVSRAFSQFKFMNS